MRKNETTQIPKPLTDDREYRLRLRFCIDNDLWCFEYHYRHRSDNQKKRKGGVRV